MLVELGPRRGGLVPTLKKQFYIYEIEENLGDGKKKKSERFSELFQSAHKRRIALLLFRKNSMLQVV